MEILRLKDLADNDDRLENSTHLAAFPYYLWIKLIDAIENQNVRDTDTAFP